MHSGKAVRILSKIFSKSLKCLNYVVYKSLDFVEAASEGLKGNEENCIENWKRQHLCNVLHVAKYLAILSPAVMGKVEQGDTVMEISKQC